MIHPFVIDTRGKLVSRKRYLLNNAANAMLKQIDKYKLVATRYFMNQADYEDILKWSK